MELSKRVKTTRPDIDTSSVYYGCKRQFHFKIRLSFSDVDINVNARKDYPRADSPRPSSSSSGARTISSDASLRSVGIETPLGIVRQSSYSNVDLGVYNATSHELFRHEISMHKLTSMPAINEDESSSEDDERPGEIKRKPKKKIHVHKTKSIKRPNSVILRDNKHNFIEEDEDGEEKEKESENEKEEKHELIRAQKPQSKGVKDFFKGLFSCTKSEKYVKAHSRLN